MATKKKAVRRKAIGERETIEVKGLEGETIQLIPKKGIFRKRAETPLQKFRKQTLLKKAQLKKTIKDCNHDLRAIERDLGVLKRKK